MTSRLLVLFDADCGICTAAAARLRRWDRDGRLELLTLQAAPSDPRPVVRDAAARHALEAELHVLDPASGRVRAGGRAVVEVIGRLPGGRLPALVGRVPPVAWLLGVAYGLVARNRRSISRALGVDASCVVPDR